MAARPAWNGHLKLSLVTCPVALYKATEAAKRGVSFNLIDPKTNDRIRMKPQDASGEEVQRSDLVKGYQVDKNLYVTVTDDELRALKVESNGAIQIERFVPEAEIDRLYWDQPYYLVPDGDLAVEPYAVIREAMRQGGQVALARVVMNGRERQFALEVRGKGIVAHAIRTHQEVRDAGAYFDRLPETKPDAAMVTIAKQILTQHAGPFDPASFVDRYQAAVLELVERKKAEQGIVRAGSRSREEPREAQIIDLMAALKASLGGGAATSGDRRKRAPAKAAAKPAPAKRTRKVG
ncbi:Ku protein [Phenylobacterium sp. J426]|uniref:non-homologous end joining protein Ku n=1 Tax=Phenylobacterium sp. J426 TaxID=2898439 RepID=UPI002150FE99|nr:Ku protein [Phenylobacterium sp. J426]MCR5874348.1 Ku protein [Phenylobacterium sp. J426]